MDTGEIAVIPIGFRCYTVEEIRKKLGIQQVSLPFNNGFFSPHSVASVFAQPEVNLVYDDNGLTHRVCIKTENHHDPRFGKGIHFESSSYEIINAIATSKDVEGIDRYLDSTFAYYTLDVHHQFVLAHYNWHEFTKSANGKTQQEKLHDLQVILNRRIERMLTQCDKAKHIFFIYAETQGYQYIQIDNTTYNLNDFSPLHSILDELFPAKYSIINLNQTDFFQAILRL